jgi:cysteine desulfurase
MIYLDNNATTQVDPAVVQAMLPYFTQHYANASSMTSVAGRKVAHAVGLARQQVADALGCQEDEIYFTSGATEAINWVIKGVFERYIGVGDHFISCHTEHKAVLDTLAAIEKKGAKITLLPVNQQGQIDLDNLRNAIQPNTVMVCLMSANNETGILHPIEQIAAITNEKKVLFFCDATQSFGKEKIDLKTIPIDLLCLSGHKCYGPKGIGALYIRKRRQRIQVEPLIHGGGQENKLRAGTLNVPAIIGLGEAAFIAHKNLLEENARLQILRDKLENGLKDLDATFIHGDQVPRLAHVSNIRFDYIQSAQLMTRMPQWAMAAGSACVSGSREPSAVLQAMGLSKEQAQSALRLSLGRFTTEEEIDLTIKQLRKHVQLLRDESPFWQLHQQGYH